MPSTVNFERHKLNQAMYQKLKRYIMSKRKRELEEKAQDDQFKKLRREREERKRQAELDTENLEKTRAEIATTKKKIKELTARRNELFQKWKKLSSEESSLKEKQRSEALTILSTMHATQFGVGSQNLGVSTKNTSVLPNVSRSTTPAQFQSVQVSHPQAPKAGVSGINLTQHHLPAHYPCSVASRDAASPHRGPQNTGFIAKPNATSLCTTVSSVLSQLPCSTSVSSGHAAAMAAVAAAVAAQRSGTTTDSIFPPTAAAAAYFSALASINAGASSTASQLAGGPLCVVNTSSIGYTEAMAALAASGLYSLSPSSVHSVNTAATSSNLTHNMSYGHRNSPVNTSSDAAAFAREITCTQANAAVVAALAQQQSGIMSKVLHTSGQRHSASTDPNMAALDSAQLCLAHLANAASAQQSQKAQQQHHHHQQQQQQQLLCSLNVINPLLSPMLGGTSIDNLGTSTPPTTVSGTGGSLPPAPIGYRGSITTGQSAQQIQLQQQQQQAHQKQHVLTKYSMPSDYTANRSVLSNQAGDHASAVSLANSAKSALTNDRLSEAAALMASIGVSNASPAFLNAAMLQAGLASAAAAVAAAAATSAASMTSTSISSASPVALTAVLTPYAPELNQFNYLNPATLAAAIHQQHQQQQQLQKMNANSNSSTSPRTRASPASSAGSSLNTSGQTNVSSVRRLF